MDILFEGNNYEIFRLTVSLINTYKHGHFEGVKL